MTYEDLRPLLFSIAYRMVGAVGDAEDLVQEAFLRLHREQQEGAEIESPRAFLTTVVTRLSIDHLRSARVRREEYVGEWLPEPLLVDTAPTPADEVEMADTLSMAFLVVLESLSPLERAVFLLHDVFSYSYAEIAEVVDKSEDNCRQIALRARRAVDARRPRFDPSEEERRAVAERFFAALSGDASDIAEVLAEDVLMHGDGGGKVPALARAVQGVDRVSRLWANWAKQGAGVGARIDSATVNGQPGAILRTASGEVLTVMSLDIVDGKVKEIRNVLNPDKLRHIGAVADTNALLREARTP
ncbi:MAG TPA: RNA polymerase sigma-70 factor [Thermoleophilaceae bacterium]|nr:RNA polymerase sigma-70 factor [Thermoleophilaceae bacterium]